MLPSSDPKFVPALHTIIILRPRRFFTQLLQKPGTKIQSIRLWKLLSVKKNPSSPDQQLRHRHPRFSRQCKQLGVGQAGGLAQGRVGLGGEGEAPAV